MNEIHYFSKDTYDTGDELKPKLGVRGYRVMELASINLPITPGFIFDTEAVKKILEGSLDVEAAVKEFVSYVEKDVGRKFGDKENPLFFKVVLSPDMELLSFNSIHNVGLNSEIVDGFANYVGEQFAYEEYRDLFINIGTKLYEMNKSKFKKAGGDLYTKQDLDSIKKLIGKFKELMGDKVPSDPYKQLASVIQQLATMYIQSEKEVGNDDAETGILVQMMAYGNYGKNSMAGSYYSRNIVTGDNELQGQFFSQEFHADLDKGTGINKIDKEYLDELKKIAENCEKHFKEIREIKFTIEAGKLWLIDQNTCDKKSTQAEIRTLLDLRKKSVIDDHYVVKKIPPHQMNELLHPVIDNESVKSFKSAKGGISGSTGAAIGRVFFSTPELIEEYRRRLKTGEDTRLILVMESTYAEDVKAIEVCTGVLTTKGGYSSHAPVVSRSLGKIAMVNPKADIDFEKRQLKIGDMVIKQGDYITLDVPYHTEPTVYYGQAKLVEPDFEKNGLIDFVEIINKYVDKSFYVRGNCDNAKDAALARSFGAEGVGLCRTEHMFFAEERIAIFREMVISEDEDERIKALDKLMPMQRKDFYELFKEMKGYEVTIRLLDAPLHEFLPHTDESLKDFITYMKKKNPDVYTKEEIIDRIERLSEFNPMLGHRGCRVAISYPEIYEMQLKAIFNAAAMLIKEGIKDIKPAIMIPIVMDKNELKFIKNGKKIEGKVIKGIKDIHDEIVKEAGIESIEYTVGSMIELPSAALQSDEIARYAEFFSFGTNDLTQTTFGISRDDINSFLPDYTEFDLLPVNPFQHLGDQVKELIQISTQRGRLTRPDLKIGLCGEHGAEPDNIEFCRKIGINYVSCSSYAVPIAKLAVAQKNIEEE
jgi:pyruvate,orthophosphate dikinase